MKNIERPNNFDQILDDLLERIPNKDILKQILEIKEQAKLNLNECFEPISWKINTPEPYNHFAKIFPKYYIRDSPIGTIYLTKDISIWKSIFLKQAVQSPIESTFAIPTTNMEEINLTRCLKKK
jgi:hypothetical protein